LKFGKTIIAISYIVWLRANKNKLIFIEHVGNLASKIVYEGCRNCLYERIADKLYTTSPAPIKLVMSTCCTSYKDYSVIARWQAASGEAPCRLAF